VKNYQAGIDPISSIALASRRNGPSRKVVIKIRGWACRELRSQHEQSMVDGRSVGRSCDSYDNFVPACKPARLASWRPVVYVTAKRTATVEQIRSFLVRSARSLREEPNEARFPPRKRARLPPRIRPRPFPFDSHPCVRFHERCLVAETIDRSSRPTRPSLTTLSGARGDSELATGSLLWKPIAEGTRFRLTRQQSPALH